METNGQQETENKIKVKLENLGTENKNRVCLETKKGSIVLFFSYQTIVSFSCWNETTGTHTDKTINKHFSNTTSRFLNTLQADKSLRVDEEEFNKSLTLCLNSLF